MAPRTVLLYDGNCAYCRAFASMLRRLDRAGRVRTVEFASPQAQALLRAQFGAHYGFAMYLFELERGVEGGEGEGGQVSWGREAARRVVQTLGLPRPIARLAFWAYPAVVRLVSLLTRRTQRVCGPECAGSSNTSGKRQQSVPLRREAQALLRSS